MVENQQECALWNQGKRDGYTADVDAREARNHPNMIYRDGWREGMLDRLLKKGT